ncbi:MAG: GGDEF domain-containing protein [Vulcanimicrobiota bacterium]
MDHFRRLNDAFGHLRGDEILLEMARLLRSQTGPNDLVARWKGDCFAVCFREQGLERALEVCEKIRDQVARDFGGRRLTLSIGLGLGPPFGSRPALVAAVEDALRRSKQGGGDRLTIADGRDGAGRGARLPRGPKGPTPASERRRLEDEGEGGGAPSPSRR